MPEKCEFEHIARAICECNGFEYVRYIDAGAFKETYQTKKQDESYALKVFKPNNSSERTEREIDAMRRAGCSNVARLINVNNIAFNGDTFLYVLEEYLAGGSLRMLLDKSILPRRRIVRLGKDIINALESTCQQHIVHRDIKPDNIMFRVGGDEAVLVDFGLVRDLDATSLTQGFFQRGPGTPLYSAPEQLNNKKELIDWRTDQFALGISLCEAAFGVHPFLDDNPIKTVDKIASMSKCNNDIKQKIIDMGLCPIIKMLEPYPINRFRTPEYLKSEWDKLEEIL